jgi:hypothetical protein
MERILCFSCSSPIGADSIRSSSLMIIGYRIVLRNA